MDVDGTQWHSASAECTGDDTTALPLAIVNQIYTNEIFKDEILVSGYVFLSPSKCSSPQLANNSMKKPHACSESHLPFNDLTDHCTVLSSVVEALINIQHGSFETRL